jgi:hypothetical protein
MEAAEYDLLVPIPGGGSGSSRGSRSCYPPTLHRRWDAGRSMASSKSFKPQDGSDRPPGSGRNAEAGFHGDTRSKRDACLESRCTALQQGTGQGRQAPLRAPSGRSADKAFGAEDLVNELCSMTATALGAQSTGAAEVWRSTGAGRGTLCDQRSASVFASLSRKPSAGRRKPDSAASVASAFPSPSPPRPTISCDWQSS